MRKAIVGMSLKNYINLNSEVKQLCEALTNLVGKEAAIEQFLFPSLGTIGQAAATLSSSTIAVGAQNIAPEENGPYTGEYSIQTLLEVKGQYVELAHYEREKIFGETTEMINQKIKLVLSKGLVPVICIGEKEEKLSDDQFEKTILEQLLVYLKDVQHEAISRVILAYEPGWAIGKEEAADSDYVHHAHTLIRKVMRDCFGKEAATKIRIIYGGSVSKSNTQAIVSHQDVDGVFLGRFGHKPADYQEVVGIVKKVKGVE